MPLLPISTTEVRSAAMRGAGLLAALAALAWAPPATGHIVYGTRTLSGLIAEADLVVHARIAEGADSLRAPAISGGESRPAVEAEVLEVLKGSFQGPRLRFAQHGHGVAPFEPGSETLLFLVDVARSRELAALDEPGGVDWVSLQEHQDRYPLPPERRARVLAVARSYVQADAATSAEERREARHQATVTLLASGDVQLQASALRDLMLAPEEPLVTGEDLPAVRPVLDDPAASIGVRVALLNELARRGLVEPDPVWQELLADTTPARDRATAIRAAGVSGSTAARARLLEILAGSDPELAAEAAAALGAPGRPEVVGPLGAALSHDSQRVRMAAIRGLGRVGSPEARAVLAQAARNHPDPATRRRAGAELRKPQAARSVD